MMRAPLSLSLPLCVVAIMIVRQTAYGSSYPTFGGSECGAGARVLRNCQPSRQPCMVQELSEGWHILKQLHDAD